VGSICTRSLNSKKSRSVDLELEAKGHGPLERVKNGKKIDSNAKERVQTKRQVKKQKGCIMGG
jgi:hypothetical protein